MKFLPHEKIFELINDQKIWTNSKEISWVKLNDKITFHDSDIERIFCDPYGDTYLAIRFDEHWNKSFIGLDLEEWPYLIIFFQTFIVLFNSGQNPDTISSLEIREYDKRNLQKILPNSVDLEQTIFERLYSKERIINSSFHDISGGSLEIYHLDKIKIALFDSNGNQLNLNLNDL